MKEIKDKKIYKTVSMIGCRCTYFETLDLVRRLEQKYGDSIIIGKDALEVVIGTLHANAKRFYDETGIGIEEVQIEFDFGTGTYLFDNIPDEYDTDRIVMRIYEGEQQRYWLYISKQDRVYVADEEEKGGEE